MKTWTRVKLLILIMFVYLLIIRVFNANYSDFWNWNSVLKIAIPVLYIIIFSISIRYDMKKIKKNNK